MQSYVARSVWQTYLLAYLNSLRTVTGCDGRGASEQDPNLRYNGTVITMAQSKVARNNALTARIDQLTADWMLSQQTREVASEGDLAGFFEPAESLCAEIDLGTLWRNTAWNLFEVLGRPRLEDAHSSVIAWLWSRRPHMVFKTRS